MTLELHIRTATADDLGAVRRLLAETWHDTFDLRLGRARVTEITDRWHAEEVLRRQLGEADGAFLIAEVGRDVVGHAFAQARHPSVLVVVRLYVRPAFQRQGIGRRLLAAALQRQPQARRIELTVEAANAKGMAFYRRHGFTVVAEVVEDGLRGLRMAKDLEGGMVRGLWNYAIKVADIERAVAFYVATLAAEVRIESEVLGCRYALIRLGATRVILFAKAPYEHLLGRELPLGFLHDVYEVTDFDAQIARLEAAGVRFIMPPQTIEAAFGRRRIAFFETPDGMRTEVMQILEDREA